MKVQMFHHLLLGAVVMAVIDGVFWLMTGDIPSPVAGGVMAMFAYLGARTLIEVRRMREVQMLRELYDRPALGE